MSNVFDRLQQAFATSSTSVDFAKVIEKLNLPKTSKAAKAGVLPSALEVFAHDANRALEYVRGSHPRDLTSGWGRRMKNEIEKFAKGKPDFRRELEVGGGLDDEGRVLGNKRARTRAEGKKIVRRQQIVLAKSRLFDSHGSAARIVVEQAIAGVKDDGTMQELRRAFDQISGVLDPEELAAQVVKKAKKLSDGHAKLFLDNVQKEGSKDLADALTAAASALARQKVATAAEIELPDLIAKDLKAELDQPKPSIASMRKRLSARAPVLLEAVAGRIDIDEVITAMLSASVRGEVAKRVARDAFDLEGWRRVFANAGSFRKLYGFEQSERAGQNLMGWLYEGTKFNRRTMEEETFNEVARMRKALKSVGVTVGTPTVNFDVWLNGKQATDHLGHVELAGPLGKTRVAAAAGEHKGVEGVKKGKKQLEDMTENYKNKTIYTETHTLKFGKDLHLDLGDALKQIGVPPNDIKKVLAALQIGPDAPAYSRVIIAPRATAGAKVPGVATGNIKRLIHDVPRDQMQELYNSLTLFFNLFPRRFGK